LLVAGGAPGHLTAKFVRLGCPCAASGECKCAEKAACGQDCAAGNATCKCCQCAAASHESGSHETVAHEAKCGEDCCEVTDVIVKRLHQQEEFAAITPHKLMQQIAQLMAEKAAAQAALAVRKEADEQIGDLYEAMAELLADNAALDARLEAQEESRKLAEKIADLAAENARLKTHIELAAERAELARASTALQLENENLKHQLAAARSAHSRVIVKSADGSKEVQEEGVRTAAKPRNERKAR
jgi:regulator of replication initiation timing